MREADGPMIERGSGTIIAPGSVRMRRKWEPGFWMQHTCMVATTLICLALLMATVGEVWVRIGLDRQAADLRAQNTQMGEHIAATRRAIQVAESSATIEHEARAWGYIQGSGR
jgi:hypothetical protein